METFEIILTLVVVLVGTIGIYRSVSSVIDDSKKRKILHTIITENNSDIIYSLNNHRCISKNNVIILNDNDIKELKDLIRSLDTENQLGNFLKDNVSFEYLKFYFNKYYNKTLLIV